MSQVFYIYSPAWADWSAGIRVLHYLCHFINESGREAFLVLHGKSNGRATVNSDLRTPLLNAQTLSQHTMEGKKIWAVYSESTPGNPLNANHIIRWLLNFPSLLGGDTQYPNERVVAYSKKIADHYYQHSGIPVDTLFVPALLSKDAELLVAVKDKKIPYKGITKKFVEEMYPGLLEG